MQVPWPIEGGTVFNLAAWQFLFFIAMVIGHHRQKLSERLSQLPRWVCFLFSGFLGVGLVQLHSTNGAFLEEWIPGLNTKMFLEAFFLKSALAPGRLIASFILLQFAYLATTLFWKPIWAALGWLLNPLGQHALYAYTMHIVIIVLFNILLSYLSGNLQSNGTINTVLQLISVLLIWIMVRSRSPRHRTE